MKNLWFAAAMLCALSAPLHAQDSDSGQGGLIHGATIPIMRAPGEGSAPTVDGMGAPVTTSGGPVGGTAPAQAPAITMTQPFPESTIQPKPLPRLETPSQLAADQVLRKQSDEQVTSQSESVSETCDASFKTRIDWISVDPESIHTNSPADMCGAVLQAVEELCANPEAQKRVAKEVKTIICTSGPAPGIALHGGTLLYTIDWQSRNPGATVYAWLASHI